VSALRGLLVYLLGSAGGVALPGQGRARPPVERPRCASGLTQGQALQEAAVIFFMV